MCICLSGMAASCALAAGQPALAGGPAVRIAADCAEIGMGRSVAIRVAATLPDGKPAAGYLLLPYVNGRRWGAQEYTDAQGQATMILPLPNPGPMEIQVEAAGGLAMRPSSRQAPQPQPSAGGPLAWAVAAGGGWPAGTLPRLLGGSRAPAGASLSNPVSVRVDFRKLAPPPSDPEHLVGVQYCELFSPRWFTWNTAQAVPLVGFYRSWDRDVLRQHLIWLAESGADFLLVDWSNQNMDRKHWDERSDNDNEVVHSTTMLLEATAALRDEGLTVPRMVIFVGLNNAPPTTVTAVNEESQWIYHNYVRNPRCHGLFLEYLGKPLLLVFNSGGPQWLQQTKQAAIDERHFTIRWISAQHDSNRQNQAGYWTWMDGAVRQPVTMFQGKPEAMTASVAFFGTDGWKGRSAVGRRGGWTYVESFRGPLEQRPRFLQLHQFQEFTGQEEDPKTTFYGDTYSVELSDDMEPVSLTCPAYRGDGGWGFYYLNLTRALVDLYRQQPAETTVLALEQPDRRQVVREDRLPLKWTWLGKKPAGFAIALDGKTVASGLQGNETVLDLHARADGPAVLRLTAEGGKARYDLSYTRDSLPKAALEPACVEVEFYLRRSK